MWRTFYLIFLQESDLELLLDDEDNEFKNGRDYMVWLKNRLPCIEVHVIYCSQMKGLFLNI